MKLGFGGEATPNRRPHWRCWTPLSLQLVEGLIVGDRILNLDQFNWIEDVFCLFPLLVKMIQWAFEHLAQKFGVSA